MNSMVIVLLCLAMVVANLEAAPSNPLHAKLERLRQLTKRTDCYDESPFCEGEALAELCPKDKAYNIEGAFLVCAKSCGLCH